MKTLARFVAPTLMFALLPGCGGSKAPKPAGAGGSGLAPAVQPAGIGEAPAQAAARPAKNKTNAPAESPAARVFGPDDFEIVNDPEPGWTIEGMETPEVAAVYEAPLPGTDSRHFDVIGAEPDSAAAQRLAARPNTPAVQNSGLTPGETAVVGPDTRPRPAAADSSDPRFPKGFEPIPSAGYAPGQWPLRIRCVKDGAELALVDAGVTRRGFQDGPANVQPEQVVLLDRFYMDVHEVTLAQFERFRAAVRSESNRTVQPALNFDKSSDMSLPALGVTWGEAKSYATWAGRELPTEAQWEKAARGPENFPHAWGFTRPLWHRPRSSGQIDPVGSFHTDMSPYGIMDLAGNAREWCADFYHDQAYQQTSGEVRNPTGPRTPSKPNQRVVRGGGDGWHAWFREGAAMNERLPDVGFRLVLNVKEVPIEAADNAEGGRPAAARRPPEKRSERPR